MGVLTNGVMFRLYDQDASSRHRAKISNPRQINNKVASAATNSVHVGRKLAAVKGRDKFGVYFHGLLNLESSEIGTRLGALGKTVMPEIPDNRISGNKISVTALQACLNAA